MVLILNKHTTTTTTTTTTNEHTNNTNTNNNKGAGHRGDRDPDLPLGDQGQGHEALLRRPIQLRLIIIILHIIYTDNSNT